MNLADEFGEGFDEVNLSLPLDEPRRVDHPQAVAGFEIFLFAMGQKGGVESIGDGMDSFPRDAQPEHFLAHSFRKRGQQHIARAGQLQQTLPVVGFQQGF